MGLFDDDFETKHNSPDVHRFGEAFILPGLPQTIGSTLSEGKASGPARADHVHTLPTGYYSHYVGTSAPSSPVEGQLWTDTSTNNLYIYNGSAWTIVGGYGEWTTYTPVLAGSGGNPNLGSTGVAAGRYVRHGRRLVTVQMKFSWGGAGVTSGAGVLTASLPINANTAIGNRRVGAIDSYVNATGNVTSHVYAYLGSTSVINGFYANTWPSGALTSWAVGAPHTLGAAGDEANVYATYEAAGD